MGGGGYDSGSGGGVMTVAVYFDGQGTQILPCGKIPGGAGASLLAYGLR